MTEQKAIFFCTNVIFVLTVNVTPLPFQQYSPSKRILHSMSMRSILIFLGNCNLQIPTLKWLCFIPNFEYNRSLTQLLFVAQKLTTIFFSSFVCSMCKSLLGFGFSTELLKLIVHPPPPPSHISKCAYSRNFQYLYMPQFQEFFWFATPRPNHMSDG